MPPQSSAAIQQAMPLASSWAATISAASRVANDRMTTRPASPALSDSGVILCPKLLSFSCAKRELRARIGLTPLRAPTLNENPKPRFRHPLLPKRRRVAMLGFAYRRISFEFTVKVRKQPPPKPLPASVKSIGDWIQVKLRENGMSPFHLAAKMGIATSMVNAWKNGLARPKSRQMREMVAILGTYRPRSFRCDRRWPDKQTNEILGTFWTWCQTLGT
jgi:hypothetical protein